MYSFVVYILNPIESVKEPCFRDPKCCSLFSRSMFLGNCRPMFWTKEAEIPELPRIYPRFYLCPDPRYGYREALHVRPAVCCNFVRSFSPLPWHCLVRASSGRGQRPPERTSATRKMFGRSPLTPVFRCTAQWIRRFHRLSNPCFTPPNDPATKHGASCHRDAAMLIGNLHARSVCPSLGPCVSTPSKISSAMPAHK